MVVPHYVYLVLKIPTEQGILTLCANVSTAYDYEREGLAIADAMDLLARMKACIAEGPSRGAGNPDQDPIDSAIKMT